MSKKMSYIDLLKEAVTNYPGYDTSKTTDVKGPFVDDIVSYEGDGEMVTYKDASSILERYYFDVDEGIENIHEQHEEEPAGSHDGETIDKEKEEIVTKMTEQEEKDEDDEKEEKDDEDEEVEDLTETEKSIVEKLIEEMEEETDKEENLKEGETEPAGAGDAEKYIPEAEDKKDDEKEEETDEEDLDVDKELEEWGTGILEEDDMEDEKEEKDEEEEKDEKKEDKKDKKDKKKPTSEAGPAGGPLGKNKSSGKKKGQYEEDEADSDVLEEQFSIFKKQIMESDDNSEDVEDIDGKDVIV